ncbi:uncharacterized protein At3g17950-like [Magnolia sinica]|uniref:uncharacterized protein At3g17950-like n=1 Tax=Magnolia sinica TaxID=86752 RepID=UPI002657E158|nr:uncharacterized protein At3g17950-like [Magnolia sinica]
MTLPSSRLLFEVTFPGFYSTTTMSHQETGWPLGLQPLSMRIGMVRNRDLSGSISFSTLITSSPASSSFSSTEFDIESTGSFFHNNSITLGNLIGTASILDLSGRRSIRRGGRPENKKNYKPKTWFCLCTRACADADGANNPPSLGHFLEAERRVADTCGRNRNSIGNQLSEFPESRSNSLFVDGRIAPPQVITDVSADWMVSI